MNNSEEYLSILAGDKRLQKRFLQQLSIDQDVFVLR
jgi:hypothetical protein